MSATPLPSATLPTSAKKLVLNWTAPAPPDDTCRYDHCSAETLFGSFSLVWEGWKIRPENLAWNEMPGDPGYVLDETPWGEFECKGWNSLEEAQLWAEAELKRRLAEQLRAYLSGDDHPSPV